MRRIVALDGLRGVAVLAVLASHTLNRARGGFLGVDVFFVLSGFLITSLLLREWAGTGRIDVRGFYRRRVARLAPAYVLMLVLAVPMMVGPLAGQARWPTWLAVAASAAYVANWASVLDVEALGPIIHTWSLSIEEQFYLVWPAAFIALSRGRRSLVRRLAAGIALIVVVRAVGWVVTHDIWVYFSTVTHADGLLAGALLAVLLGRRGDRPAGAGEGRVSAVLAGLGVAVLAGLAATASVESGATYLVGLTLASAATAAVVRHLVLVPHGRLGQVLRWWPLVAVGRVSYGLYLYHLPIFVLVQSRHLGLAATLGLEVVATTALAAASWVWLEQPIQRRAHRRPTSAPTPVIMQSLADHALVPDHASSPQPLPRQGTAARPVGSAG